MFGIIPTSDIEPRCEKKSDGSEIRTEYFTNGQISKETHSLGVKLHNTNGPAYRDWHSDGRLFLEEYYIDGKLHREDGPALTIWNRGNNSYYELNLINHKLTRINGYIFRFYIDNELVHQI